MPSTRIIGPDAVPPKPFIGSPALRIRIVEYVRLFPRNKNALRTKRNNKTPKMLTYTFR
jgi:hypothetical protein